VNAEHFAWAVQNLLDNAVKYCPKDRIPQVNIRAEAIDDHHWQLSVQDNGGGIPPAYQSKLFDRFYRAPSEGNVKGFGLGLYVARRIVEAHGGQIYLKESSEKGSTFTIVLPFSVQNA
jgi:signal transduction histidine kinase